jgi:hypothetical protein
MSDEDATCVVQDQDTASRELALCEDHAQPWESDPADDDERARFAAAYAKLFNEACVMQAEVERLRNALGHVIGTASNWERDRGHCPECLEAKALLTAAALSEEPPQ